jgi:hypothetical protein
LSLSSNENFKKALAVVFEVNLVFQAQKISPGSLRSQQGAINLPTYKMLRATGAGGFPGLDRQRLPAGPRPVNRRIIIVFVLREKEFA